MGISKTERCHDVPVGPSQLRKKIVPHPPAEMNETLSKDCCRLPSFIVGGGWPHPTTPPQSEVRVDWKSGWQDWWWGICKITEMYFIRYYPPCWIVTTKHLPVMATRYPATYPIYGQSKSTSMLATLMGRDLKWRTGWQGLNKKWNSGLHHPLLSSLMKHHAMAPAAW